MQENIKLFVQDVKKYWNAIHHMEFFDPNYKEEIAKLVELHQIATEEVSHWIACAKLGIIRPYEEPKAEVNFKYKYIQSYNNGSGPGRRVLRCNKSIQ